MVIQAYLIPENKYVYIFYSKINNHYFLPKKNYSSVSLSKPLKNLPKCAIADLTLIGESLYMKFNMPPHVPAMARHFPTYCAFKTITFLDENFI